MDAGLDYKILEQTTGIPSMRLHEMQLVFQRYNSIESVRLFGARANGKFNDRSGVNLALFGVFKLELLKSLASELNALKTGYVFDMRAYSEMNYPPMRKHVDTEGVEIYRAERSRNLSEIQPLSESTGLEERPRRPIPWALLAGVIAFVVALLLSWKDTSVSVAPMSFVLGPFAFFIPYVFPLIFALVVGGLVKLLVAAIRFFRDEIK